MAVLIKIFQISFFVGVGLTLISLVFGNLLDLLHFDTPDIDVDLDGGGGGILFSPLVIVIFLTVFFPPFFNCKKYVILMASKWVLHKKYVL